MGCFIGDYLVGISLSNFKSLQSSGRGASCLYTFLEATFISSTLILTFPSLSLINILTPLTSSSEHTNPTFSLSSSSSNATPKTLPISNAFGCCSAYSGHASIGTPNHRHSKHKFHLQCVTNPSTAGRENLSIWAAQDGHTTPPLLYPFQESFR